MKPLHRYTVRQLRDLLADMVDVQSDYADGKVAFGDATPVVSRWLDRARDLLPDLDRALGRRHRKPTEATARDTARREEDAEARRVRVMTIRQAVIQRSGGTCEAHAVQGITMLGTEMDHWLGGSGRRQAAETIETCWWLCWGCHRARHRSLPSAAYWNDVFRKHCQRHGLEFTPHKELPVSG